MFFRSKVGKVYRGKIFQEVFFLFCFKVIYSVLVKYNVCLLLLGVKVLDMERVLANSWPHVNC